MNTRVKISFLLRYRRVFHMIHLARFGSYCRELPGRIDPLYEVLAFNFEIRTLRRSGVHSGVQLDSLSNDQSDIFGF